MHPIRRLLVTCVDDSRAYGIEHPTFLRALKALILDSGYRMLCLHRVSHKMIGGRLARPMGLLLWQLNAVLHGCHISPEANIGARVRFPHAVGIVIGSAVKIGDDSTIYQNVTIGRRSVKDVRVPHIGRNVTVYTGAVIVGGIEVADGSVVGANAVVKASVVKSDRVQAGAVHG